MVIENNKDHDWSKSNETDTKPVSTIENKSKHLAEKNELNMCEQDDNLDLGEEYKARMQMQWKSICQSQDKEHM